MNKYPNEKYPTITVIMPVLNAAKTIEKAILSLINQNYPNLEFMIMDAASTDGTLEIIEKYKPYISYFRSYKDGGNAAAQNEARAICKGEIISLLCADDFFEPGTFPKVGEAFIENPDVEIVSVLGRMVKEDKQGNIITDSVCKKEDMYIANGHVKILHPNCRFFKKSLFEKYGGIIASVDEKPTVASDYEYITRFSLYNPKNITLDFVGYNYLGHTGSLTFNNDKYTKLKLSDQKVYYIERLLKDHSHMIIASEMQKFNKAYDVAFQHRVVKNLVDGDYVLFRKNLTAGTKKFGFLFAFKVFRYYISYRIRFNKIIRKLKQYL